MSGRFYFMEEIWKEICGYEGYYKISNLGNVASIDRITSNKKKRKGQALIPQLVAGYLTAHLCKSNRGKICKIHRLVAVMFIPNPENKPQVNHINCIKTDNRLENLEWATAKENVVHSVQNNLRKKRKR